MRLVLWWWAWLFLLDCDVRDQIRFSFGRRCLSVLASSIFPDASFLLLFSRCMWQNIFSEWAYLRSFWCLDFPLCFVLGLRFLSLVSLVCSGFDVCSDLAPIGSCRWISLLFGRGCARALRSFPWTCGFCNGTLRSFVRACNFWSLLFLVEVFIDVTASCCEGYIALWPGPSGHQGFVGIAFLGLFLRWDLLIQIFRPIWGFFPDYVFFFFVALQPAVVPLWKIYTHDWVVRKAPT